jgi:hypothetical protein
MFYFFAAKRRKRRKKGWGNIDLDNNSSGSLPLRGRVREG